MADDLNSAQPETAIYDTVRRAGGRLTVPMRVVVSILLGGDGHPTADDLIAEVNRQTPGIAPSTVYRVLSRLEELDIIEHVHAGTGGAFYQLRDHSHLHLVCNHCGAITDIPENVFAQVSRTVLETYDFLIEPRHAALLGSCASCLRRR